MGAKVKPVEDWSVAARKAYLEGASEWVRCDELLIPPEYQRTLDVHHVHRIIAEFDPHRFDDPIVSRRVSKKGRAKLYVIDGQHRLEVYKELGWAAEGQKIRVRILDGLSIEDEASIFGEQIIAKSLSQCDRLRADHAAGRDDAIGAVNIVEAAGYRILRARGEAVSKDPNLIRAIGAVRSVYQALGAPVLLRVLELARAAYPDEPLAIGDAFIRGAALFFELYEEEGVDDEWLQQELGAISISVLLSEAASQQHLQRTTLPRTVAARIRHYYNRRRGSTEKLPEWDLENLKQRRHVMRHAGTYAAAREAIDKVLGTLPEAFTLADVRARVKDEKVSEAAMQKVITKMASVGQLRVLRKRLGRQPAILALQIPTPPVPTTSSRTASGRDDQRVVEAVK